MLEMEGLDLLDMIAVATAHERVEHVPGVSVLYQTTASSILVKITDGLRSSEVQKIGIWGMGGVGKTTLVRTLNNKLQKEAATQPFGLVIFATASKDFDPRTVQKQIAERLEIDTRLEETVERLARRIYVRLEKETNFLLILDDVWKDIDLDLLGIPRTEEKKGSKIILTSRFLEVCRSMRTDLDVRVDCLCEEEAWELFCQNVGEVARSDFIEPIAKAISLECGGLPLAIITVGTALRGKTNVKLWKHALNQLSRSVPWIRSIEEKIYQPLKLSYDLLEGHAKSCFLLCALFPEDYSIEVAELVMYWIAEGFLEEQGSHEESMNEGITMVESLKDYCLLEDGSRRETVKMHDVVRDFAIWIMSSSQDACHSLVLSGTGLQEIRQDKFAPSLRWVSLMNNKLERLPGLAEEYCMEASTLLLQGNYLLQEASEVFLQAFSALRILNLSGTRVNSLPASCLHLSKLHSLFLRGCANLTELPSLETLAKLELLDLCGTHIKEFPKGLEKLESFKHLDLSRTIHLKIIPARVVSRLSSLETLDMTSSQYHWSVEGEEQEGEATLEELACLDSLQALSISLSCSPSFLTKSNAWIKRLKKFQLVVGSGYVLPMRHDKRRLTISNLNLSQVSMAWLFSCTTSLALNRCQGLQGMIKKLVTDNKIFVNLKSLMIENASINLSGGKATTKTPTPDLLPFLEELHLRRVNLVSLSELQAQLGLRLVALKLLELSMCPNLQTVNEVATFTIPNLEELDISYCDSLKNLRGNFDPLPRKAFLPNLRVMKLRNLPRLVTVRYEKESWECLEQVEIINCGQLYTLPISSTTCGRIKEIKGDESWWTRLRWDNPSILKTLDPCFKPLGSVHDETSPVFGLLTNLRHS
ncbi:Disease resistance protein [Hirschfeldia incana]|nr:Disease resistance protein [Hirschfeldia incana]